MLQSIGIISVLVPCLAALLAGGWAWLLWRRTIRLDRLLPGRTDTYRYGGSLTTAPFSEGVNWVVMVGRFEASQDQVAAHMELVSAPTPRCDPRPNPPGNARPIQDLAGRKVLLASG